MKLFAPDFGRHAGGPLIVILLFLVASAFDIQAQNAGDPPARADRQSLVKDDSSPFVERTDQSTQYCHTAEAYMRLTADAQVRRLADASTTPVGPMPSQSSPNGSYVFPTRHERFKRYVGDTVGPWTLVAIAAAAGLDQWDNSPPEWRQGASGFGKRFASNLGENAIQQTTSYGLSEAFHLDSSFNKSNHSGFGPRLGDALLEN